MTGALKQYGFIQSNADYSLFTYHHNVIFLGILIYVGDLILAGNNSDACADLIQCLSTCFKLKDVGPLKYFLGIEVARGSTSIFLYQRKYTLDILYESSELGA